VLSRRINVLDVVFDGLQLAGFQVSITGRFWVSTEGIAHLRCNRQSIRFSNSPRRMAVVIVAL
jgi:ligand-binding sensor domain-containing protein